VRRERLVGFAGYPLVVEGDLVGVMALYTREPVHDEVLVVLGTTADIIAIGIERKRAEEERSRVMVLEREARGEAEAERARLRSLFMQAPIPIAVLAGPEHVYQLANPLFCEMVGRSDLLGKSVEAVSPGSPGTPLLDRAFREGLPTVASEYPIPRPGGADEGIFRIVLDPYRDAAGAVQGLMMVAVDVTDEVTAKRKVEAHAAGLADERQWLESLLDVLPVPLLLLEALTGDVAFANKAADRAAGGAYPRVPSDAYHYLDAGGARIPEEMTPCKRAARGETMGGLEADWRTPLGTKSLRFSSELLDPAHGHPATVLLAFEDVTERKRTQAALHTALDETFKFVSVAEESSEFIGIAALDETVLFVNRGGQALLGLDGPGHVRRTTVLDYLFPEDREGAQKFLCRVGSEGHHEGEFRFRHFRTGQALPMWANVFLLRDRQTQAPIAMATVAHDLTEHKRAAELRERLLGIVGHDLRNPLAAIVMGASLIKSDPQSGPLQIRTAERIQGSARRMQSIIRDLLDLTKARVGGGIEVTPRRTDAHRLCERIVEELRAANPGREMRLATVGNGEGSWDVDRLEQVVSNLVSNALQYGPEDQAVDVESRGTDGEWMLSVHNLGDPIPPEVLPRIFDPFTRGRERAARGTPRGSIGLGLFIVHELVMAHRGKVEVASRAGEGTRFIVRLPRGL
jgi:PAS domain S-box-containing protein